MKKTALIVPLLMLLLWAGNSVSAQQSEATIEQIAAQHDLSGDEVRKGLTDFITNILDQNSANEFALSAIHRLNLGLNSQGLSGSPDRNQTAITNQTGVGNKASIEQVGEQNFAGISQVGERNAATIDQNGFGNHGAINQSGFSNSAKMNLVGSLNHIAVNQYGDHNIFDLDLHGNDNFLDLTQQGNYNTYERKKTGNGVLNETVLQIGNGNTSTQIGGLSNGRSANIIQQGSGMEVSIRHD